MVWRLGVCENRISVIHIFFVSLQNILYYYMKRFFRFIVLIVNLLFVALMLLSSFAGAVSPSRFVWISLLSYAFFPLLLCNVVFIIIWLCMSRWEFLISVAAIVLRYSFVPLFFQVGGTMAVEPAEDNLKVLTFNVHSFSGLDSDTLMTRDSAFNLFLEILDEEQPDVFCLQECFVSKKCVEVLGEHGYRHHFGVHGTEASSQLVIYSRTPFVNVNTMDTRSKCYADVEKNGVTVRICTVHLDSYQLDDNDLAHLEKLSHAQADKAAAKNILEKFKETTRQHDREWNEELKPLLEKTDVPIIIAGDYNDTPASYLYQRATRVLKDPYVEQGRGFGTTYHGPYPAFRIDYLLHSPELEALSYRRIKTNISDHYPIVVQFKLGK